MGDRNWQGGTSFGCQNWSGGTVFGGGPIFSLQSQSNRAVSKNDVTLTFWRAWLISSASFVGTERVVGFVGYEGLEKHQRQTINIININHRGNEEKKYLRHYNLYMCTPSTDELLTFCLPEQLCTRSVFTTNRTKGYFRHFSTRHVRASFL